MDVGLESQTLTRVQLQLLFFLFFWKFSKFIKRKKLKYHIDIGIQTLFSALSWSTNCDYCLCYCTVCATQYYCDYSLNSSWVLCYQLFNPGFGDFWPFFSADPSSSVRLDGDHWWTAFFRSLQRYSLGSIQGDSMTFKEMSLSHSCVLSVIVLLEGEPSAQSEVLSALDQFFFAFPQP